MKLRLERQRSGAPNPSGVKQSEGGGVGAEVDWFLYDAREFRSNPPKFDGDKEGAQPIQTGHAHNIIVRLGLAAHAKAIFVATADPVTSLGVGSGTSVPATTDTALQTETLVKAFTESSESGLTGDTPYYETTTQFNEGEANANLTEWGLFTGDDVMYNRARFASGVITGATQADPVVITDVSHGLTDTTPAKRILISSVGGMTQLNGNRYYVDVLTADTFALYNDEDLTDTLDGSGFSAYTSGGTWIQDIPKTSARILRIRVRVTLRNPA